MTLPRIRNPQSAVRNQKPFLLVAGARPNFMKVAPILRALRRRKIACRLLNTGQHHDPALSDVFLRDLGLGRPDYNLNVGSGTHAQTVARMLERAEPILQKLMPRAVIVVGDVNSTLAMALAAAKLNLPVAHVEAGLRSHDRTMPEEINRLLTDLLSDLLLTPSPDADANLRAEGIPVSRIVRVGNVMIDSLRLALQRSSSSGVRPGAGFFLMTFHRPSNVDTRASLARLLCFLEKAAQRLPVQLPLHPRTRLRLRKHGLWRKLARIRDLKILEPLGYFDFVNQMRRAAAVVTDSGGIQEETSYLGVPCLIMRTTTERPICIERGTSELMGEDYDAALRRLSVILKGQWKKPRPIPLWDGQAAERIVHALLKRF
ncbi:MAG: UDP-N-acetylglucosamine 2-epimerase (non-hydrolyzing) [Verrucomicrobia bacterium]|nr:UDP-N-acetylglucosamine 2-epimerase (non-hydrolyzing) [Verrucomicrobiota bacterium]